MTHIEFQQLQNKVVYEHKKNYLILSKMLTVPALSTNILNNLSHNL